jgi:hypothetical protein
VGETLDEITRHHREGPTPLLGETRPDLPSHVATTLARAMRRRPADRFAGALDFVTALAGVPLAEPVPVAPLASGPVLVPDIEPPVPVEAETPKQPRRRSAAPPDPPKSSPSFRRPPA